MSESIAKKKIAKSCSDMLFSLIFILLLFSGLIAGMVTFGGAYTTLPFIYAAAVQTGGWLSQRAFLDAIAITNMMPTPLVMFVTLVGYVGHGIGGECWI